MDIGDRDVVDRGVGEVLADATAFFEAYLWESGRSSAARDALVRKKGLDEEVIRAFGVGYAPIGRHELMEHLHALGYSTEEMEAAGLASRSPRGRPHAHFRSRLMFPVRDRDGRTVGFAGLGTHLGPSWPLWVTSPDTALYRRAAAVFGLDRAASEIAASSTVIVRPDCIEVLRTHQEGATNAVTVHTNRLTREQLVELAGGAPEAVESLNLELPTGMVVESDQLAAPRAAPDRRRDRSGDAARGAGDRPAHLWKRVAVVTAAGVAAMNAWTGAPLLAVWVGSQVQSGRLLSMWGVLTVVVMLAVLTFLLALALTWLNAQYDRLTGRPLTAAQTSPWHRAKRGDRVQDIRSRYGMSAVEKVVAASVVAGVLAFEVWFFFFAGSSL